MPQTIYYRIYYPISTSHQLYIIRSLWECYCLFAGLIRVLYRRAFIYKKKHRKGYANTLYSYTKQNPFFMFKKKQFQIIITTLDFINVCTYLHLSVSYKKRAQKIPRKIAYARNIYGKHFDRYLRILIVFR